MCFVSPISKGIWDVMLCCFVGVCQHFRGFCSDNGGNRIIWNISTLYQTSWCHVPESNCLHSHCCWPHLTKKEWYHTFKILFTESHYIMTRCKPWSHCGIPYSLLSQILVHFSFLTALNFRNSVISRPSSLRHPMFDYQCGGQLECVMWGSHGTDCGLWSHVHL